MVETKIAIVTGANKGIGLAIVRQLALCYPSSPLRSGPLLVYLTARSPERGAQAVAQLNQDQSLKNARVLAANGGDTTIKYHELDISQRRSIHKFRDYLKQEHPGGIDIVINNAGIRLKGTGKGVALEGFNAEVVRETLATNYYGTLEATIELLPLLRAGGRVVNVASMAGNLNKYSEEIHEAFRKAAQTDVAAVTALMEDFQTAADEGRVRDAGWVTRAYCVSKSGEIGITKVLAMEEEKKGEGVLLNACCPGFVQTDMTKGGGAKTPDEGARLPVRLALEDIGGKTGEFWQNGRVKQW